MQVPNPESWSWSCVVRCDALLLLIGHWHRFSCFCRLQVADSSESSAASSRDDNDGNGDGNGDDDGKGAEPDLPLVDFGVVVAGKERFDVCRLFLASLQLVGHAHARCLGVINDDKRTSAACCCCFLLTTAQRLLPGCLRQC